jgi:hypothetical protein
MKAPHLSTDLREAEANMFQRRRQRARRQRQADIIIKIISASGIAMAIIRNL